MSEDLEEKRKQTSTDAIRMLKKVLAGQGNVQGNFYIVTSGSAKEAGMAVTLTKKDKKGANVLKSGKKMKTGLKQAKFARGTVHCINGKLILNPVKQTASDSLIKKAIKLVMIQKYKLGFFKKLILRKLSDAEVESNAVESEDTNQTMDLTEEDRAEAQQEGIELTDVADVDIDEAELEQLRAQMAEDAELNELLTSAASQEAIRSMNQELAESFLSKEDYNDEVMYDTSVDIANFWWEHEQENGKKGKDQPVYFPDPVDLDKISIVQKNQLEGVLGFYQGVLNKLVPDVPSTGDAALDEIVLLHRALLKDSLNYPLTKILLVKLQSYKDAKAMEEYQKYGCFMYHTRRLLDKFNLYKDEYVNPEMDTAPETAATLRDIEEFTATEFLKLQRVEVVKVDNRINEENITKEEALLSARTPEERQEIASLNNPTPEELSKTVAGARKIAEENDRTPDKVEVFNQSSEEYLAQLYIDGAKAQLRLQSLSESAAANKALGCVSETGSADSIKGHARARYKADINDPMEDTSDYASLADLARGSLVFADIEKILPGVEYFINNLPPGSIIPKFKNRFQAESGYRDVIMTFTLDNGHISEMQFHSNIVHEAKSAKHKSFSDGEKAQLSQAVVDIEALVSQQVVEKPADTVEIISKIAGENFELSGHDIYKITRWLGGDLEFPEGTSQAQINKCAEITGVLNTIGNNLYNQAFEQAKAGKEAEVARLLALDIGTARSWLPTA